MFGFGKKKQRRNTKVKDPNLNQNWKEADLSNSHIVYDSNNKSQHLEDSDLNVMNDFDPSKFQSLANEAPVFDTNFSPNPNTNTSFNPNLQNPQKSGFNTNLNTSNNTQGLQSKFNNNLPNLGSNNHNNNFQNQPQNYILKDNQNPHTFHSPNSSISNSYPQNPKDQANLSANNRNFNQGFSSDSNINQTESNNQFNNMLDESRNKFEEYLNEGKQQDSNRFDNSGQNLNNSIDDKAQYSFISENFQNPETQTKLANSVNTSQAETGQENNNINFQDNSNLEAFDTDVYETQNQSQNPFNDQIFNNTKPQQNPTRDFQQGFHPSSQPHFNSQNQTPQNPVNNLSHPQNQIVNSTFNPNPNQNSLQNYNSQAVFQTNLQPQTNSLSNSSNSTQTSQQDLQIPTQTDTQQTSQPQSNQLTSQQQSQIQQAQAQARQVLSTLSDDDKEYLNFINTLVAAMTGLSLLDIAEEQRDAIIEKCTQIFSDFVIDYVKAKYGDKEAMRLKSGQMFQVQNVFDRFKELGPMFDEAYNAFLEVLKHSWDKEEPEASSNQIQTPAFNQNQPQDLNQNLNQKQASPVQQPAMANSAG